MNPKIITRYAVRETLGLTIMGIALFASAGTLAWPAGWAALAVLTGWTIATAVAILRTNPALLAERLGPRKGAKSWDTAILAVLGLAELARCIVAGLDLRYGWTTGFPPAAQLAGLAIAILGYALLVWATASNKFFSQVVRIQTERDHCVACGGPYRYVRHPGYLGALLAELGLPVLLASWPAILLGVLCAGVLLLRTALEDRTLQAELPGYSGYAHQVRSRLLPGVW